MPIWKLVIRPDPEEADLAQGYARAETCREALSHADHPFAYAFPQHPDKPWPGLPWESVMWVNGFSPLPSDS